MKWTTSNVKNPNYTENHEFYVGTQTGSLKKFSPTYKDDPFVQHDLHKLGDRDSNITTLTFAKDNESEILIGRAKATIEVHSLDTQSVVKSFEINGGAPVVGLAQYDGRYIVGMADGRIQRLLREGECAAVPEVNIIKAGDNMDRLRQCSLDRRLVACGGKGRQNNLKVFDLAVGKILFSSKNLPNDYLQLEVPVWDSDVGFIDSPQNLATCSRLGYVRLYDVRKQRRPVQCFATDKQMSFTSLAAKDNYIYVGTTMGAMKAFDIRSLKNFVHTYKGFTGGICDLQLDSTGKYLLSGCLDRYVRLHHVDSCVLMYQCYTKSKITRVLIRDTQEIVCDDVTTEGCATDQTHKSEVKLKKKTNAPVDEEYEQMFESMQTICDNEDVDKGEVNESDNQNVRTQDEKIITPKNSKRKLLQHKTLHNKKKK
uniref:WD repeat-containing protein 74 n=1 Tax=Glossina pallidipes TaxID=7398 RepID=A0A1B0AG91_GLOPL